MERAAEVEREPDNGGVDGGLEEEEREVGD